MQAILDPKHLVSLPKKSIVTIGVFDGVHLGHRSILEETVRWARAEKAQSVVLTFRRHPDVVLKGLTPAIISSLEHRLVLLEKLGIDLVIVFNFDDAVRQLGAEEFCKEWLVERLHTKGLVLGPDNAIGRNREGTFDRLSEIGKRLGFQVKQVMPELLRGKQISSTAIREAIQRGDLQASAEMLGRTPSLYGTVVHGDDRGHQLGFPTANLNVHHSLTPGRGVYFGWTEIEGKKIHALINIGRRPTFKEKEPQDIVEAFLLDYEGDLYGKALEIHLLKKLRDEKKFPSAEALKTQIEKDIATARSLIHSLK